MVFEGITYLIWYSCCLYIMSVFVHIHKVANENGIFVILHTKYRTWCLYNCHSTTHIYLHYKLHNKVLAIHLGSGNQ